MRTRVLSSFSAAAVLLAASSVTAVASPWEQADVLSPDTDLATPEMTRVVVVEDGASILRSPKGITASLTMPTPEPGSYVLPGGPTGTTDAGPPEAFSLWAFVFYNPGACTGPCDGSDLPAAGVVAGAYNVGGHIAGGPMLTLSGHVNPNTMSFGPANAETLGAALDAGLDLADAEIHLAVAPHGALTPELLPASISTPVGTAPFWWVAIFAPAA